LSRKLRAICTPPFSGPPSEIPSVCPIATASSRGESTGASGHEMHSIRKRADLLVRSFDRQSRFADATLPDQGHQPTLGLRQPFGDARQFGLSANERGGRHWQMGPNVCARNRVRLLAWPSPRRLFKRKPVSRAKFQRNCKPLDSVTVWERDSLLQFLYAVHAHTSALREQFLGQPGRQPMPS
jgi:hypothetical protein